MSSNLTISRRALLAGLAAASSLPASAVEALPTMTVTKDPGCGYCGAWVDHVPQELASCHTAEIDGYVIEGHVPADAIKRLLVERPRAKGLAVPGMPVGSPGMEVEGVADDTYEVILFGPSGQGTFARYQGSRPL